MFFISIVLLRITDSTLHRVLAQNFIRYLGNSMVAYQKVTSLTLLQNLYVACVKHGVFIYRVLKELLKKLIYMHMGTLMIYVVFLSVENFFSIKPNPLSANPTKWSNTVKQFVGNLPTNCLNVFDHFVILGLKGLIIV